MEHERHCKLDHSEQIKEILSKYEPGDSIIIYTNRERRMKGGEGPKAELFICSEGKHTIEALVRIGEVTGAASVDVQTIDAITGEQVSIFDQKKEDDDSDAAEQLIKKNLKKP